MVAALSLNLSVHGREILQQGDEVRAVRMLVDNPVSDFELKRFFEDKLSSNQREELDRLSPDEMKRQLRRLYMWSQLGLAHKNGETTGR
jgi:hypothetical protein